MLCVHSLPRHQTISLLSAILLTTTLTMAKSPKAHFYVSPHGNDNWSGNRPTPTADKKDGPFATLTRAQQAVRTLRAKSKNQKGDIIVLVRGGMYSLAKPLLFTPADSGNTGRATVFRAYPGETPVLSGGRAINNWTVTNKGWTAKLPANTKPFGQLFVNDQRRFRPRLPEKGYFRFAANISPTPKHAKKGHDRMVYPAGSINPKWQNLGDVEIMGFHKWSASRMRIKHINEQKRIITFTGPSRTLKSWGAFLKGYRFQVVNVKEALRKPGQWYYDRLSQTLRYLPRPGETPQTARVIVPQLTTLLKFQGQLDKSGKTPLPVANIRFEGLTFAHSNWSLPTTGQSFPQAEVHQSAAIETHLAEKLTFDRCVIRHTGGYAVSLDSGSRYNTVNRCEMIDLGAGGVKIGTMGGKNTWLSKQAAAQRILLPVEHNTVEDCLIAHGGRLHPAAVGVWIGHASHNRVVYNDIHDLYYTGVSIGWTWGYGIPWKAHHNELGWNRIYNIGQEILSDMGGVYTLGISPGTTVHHNIIHDVRGLRYGGWGLYTDEGSSGIVMSHNLVYNTRTGSFHQHYGKNNRIVNNILAESEWFQLQRSRVEDHTSFTFERNIVYWTTKTNLLQNNWPGHRTVMDHNLYWNPKYPVRFPGGLSLKQWQLKKNNDLNSLVADPLFVNPAKHDYRLKPNSPALKLGYKPWDFTQAGRRSKTPLTAKLPRVPAGYEKETPGK